jgi:hypothetical protein
MTDHIHPARRRCDAAERAACQRAADRHCQRREMLEARLEAIAGARGNPRLQAEAAQIRATLADLARRIRRHLVRAIELTDWRDELDRCPPAWRQQPSAAALWEF